MRIGKPLYTLGQRFSTTTPGTPSAPEINYQQLKANNSSTLQNLQLNVVNRVLPKLINVVIHFIMNIIKCIKARIAELVAYRLGTREVPGSYPGKGVNFSVKTTNWIVFIQIIKKCNL